MSKLGDNEHLWSQFIKLGDMMGDGLHYEEPWISKEYKKLARILVPEIKEQEKAVRKLRAIEVDKKIAILLETIPCSKCGGKLKQSRSGSKIAYCTACNSRFKAGKKK